MDFRREDGRELSSIQKRSRDRDSIHIYIYIFNWKSNRPALFYRLVCEFHHFFLGSKVFFLHPKGSPAFLFNGGVKTSRVCT